MSKRGPKGMGGTNVRGPKTYAHMERHAAYCPDCDLKLPYSSTGFSTCRLCGVEFEVSGDGTARRTT